MTESELTKALKYQGYSDYLTDVFVKMYKDLEGRCIEYSKLTGITFGITCIQETE